MVGPSDRELAWVVVGALEGVTASLVVASLITATQDGVAPGALFLFVAMACRLLARGAMRRAEGKGRL